MLTYKRKNIDNFLLVRTRVQYVVNLKIDAIIIRILCPKKNANLKRRFEGPHKVKL